MHTLPFLFIAVSLSHCRRLLDTVIVVIFLNSEIQFNSQWHELCLQQRKQKIQRLTLYCYNMADDNNTICIDWVLLDEVVAFG